MAEEPARKILVIGATGVIGSAVAARLNAEGFDVLATRQNAAGKGGRGLRWVKIVMAHATAQQWVAAHPN
jgi:nucleoside-diphosphate-sugar epimerase